MSKPSLIEIIQNAKTTLDTSSKDVAEDIRRQALRNVKLAMQTGQIAEFDARERSINPGDELPKDANAIMASTAYDFTEITDCLLQDRFNQKRKALEICLGPASKDKKTRDLKMMVDTGRLSVYHVNHTDCEDFFEKELESEEYEGRCGISSIFSYGELNQILTKMDLRSCDILAEFDNQRKGFPPDIRFDAANYPDIEDIEEAKAQHLLEIANLIDHYLNKLGFDIDYKPSKYADSLLIKAARQNCPQIIRYALDHGAEIDQKDASAANALIIATRNGCLESAAMLIRESNRKLIDYQGPANMTALMQAVKTPAAGKTDSAEIATNKIEIAKLLLQSGCRLDCISTSGQTAYDMCGNKDRFVDLIIENYNKDVFLRGDGDHDLAYISKLIKIYEAKEDYLRCLKLETLVENILRKFPTACNTFSKKDDIIVIGRNYDDEKIIIQSDIEKIRTKYKRDILEEAESLLLGDAEVQSDVLESTKLELITLKLARLELTKKSIATLQEKTKRPTKVVSFSETVNCKIISGRKTAATELGIEEVDSLSEMTSYREEHPSPSTIRRGSRAARKISEGPKGPRPKL